MYICTYIGVVSKFFDMRLDNYEDNNLIYLLSKTAPIPYDEMRVSIKL